MKRLQNVKGAVFDLDGTILDSMWLWKQIDIDFLGKRGLEVPKDYMKSINHLNLADTAKYTINRFGFKDSPEELMNEWLGMAQVAYCEKINLKPYAKSYLEQLKQEGVKLSVATSLSPNLAFPALERGGVLDYFDKIITADQVKRGKGFPDIYLKAIEHTNFDASDCVVFEDILQGIKGAKAGGFLTVGVFDKESEPDSAGIIKTADIFIKGFDELLK